MEFKVNVFRDVLIYLQDNSSYDNTVNSREIKVKDYSPDDIAYAVELIAGEGFIVYTDMGGFNYRYKCYLIDRLTMPGHEFISTIKNDTVWNGVLQKAGEIGVEAIKATIPLLVAYVTAQLDMH